MFTDLVLFFQSHVTIYLTFLFILGLLIGSFLNVVIYRLPIMMQRDWRNECLDFLDQPPEAETEKFNLSLPRSRCVECDHAISALENIPIVSYLALRGKCRECKTPISMRYPMVELFTGVISLAIGWHFGVSIQALAGLFFSWCLIAASGIDLGHKLLPDTITLPLMWLGILLSLFNVFIDLETSVIGAIAGYLFLWSVFWLFKLATGKEGMGHGDFKLLAALGAWCGWEMLLVIVLTSSMIAAIIGIMMIILGKTERSTQIPFGPYLAGAGWISFLWGPVLLSTYLGIL
ncbi:MAG: leader peptidase (prepilin peptidase)/N-methyltransferase [Polaribacter sp.]|jgi:leader peptidase (prepilin peptidase)/N-methyltransferase